MQYLWSAPSFLCPMDETMIAGNSVGALELVTFSRISTTYCGWNRAHTEKRGAVTKA